MSVSEPKIHRFTVDQFQFMGEVGLLSEDDRVELLNGKIVDMTPIGSRHFACVVTVHELLADLLGREVIVAVQSPIQLADSQPQPDIAVLRRRDDRYARTLPTASDTLLVVEVSDSTSLVDRNVKRLLYAGAGVAEYWIADVRNKSVVVYRSPSHGDYDDVREYRANEAWASLALDGREIRARDVLGPAVDAR